MGNEGAASRSHRDEANEGPASKSIHEVASSATSAHASGSLRPRERHYANDPSEAKGRNLDFEAWVGQVLEKAGLAEKLNDAVAWSKKTGCSKIHLTTHPKKNEFVREF